MADFSRFYTSNGRFAYKTMFYEMSTPKSRKKMEPMFTLKAHDHKGYPSAYLIYMGSVDEFDAAKKLAPSHRIWEMMTEAHWFMHGDPVRSHDGLASWRQHMKARDDSMAKALLLEKVKEGDVTSARALLAEGKKKHTTKRKKIAKQDSPEVTMIKEFKQRTGKL